MGLKYAVYSRPDGCYETMSFNGRVRSTLLIARLSFLLPWAKGKNVRQHSVLSLNVGESRGVNVDSLSALVLDIDGQSGCQDIGHGGGR